MEWFIDYRKTALGEDPTESGTTDYRRTTRHDIPHDILFSRAGLPTLSSRREVEQIVFVFKFLHNFLPDHVLDKLMHWNKKKPER